MWNDGLRFLLELVRRGCGGLLAAGSTALALVFAALVVLHLALTFALGQRPATTAR
jgi:hypothetical protein